MAKANQKNGTIESFNFSPKGGYEGFLMKAGKSVAQLNFPREEADEIAKIASEGMEVETICEEEHKGDGHPVYKLIELKSKRGSWPGKGGQFAGKVVRLNYALHGEVNGGVLDSGDFLHLKPHGAEAIGIAVGMKVEGRGKMKPMANGSRVIEAEEVNGTRIGHPHGH